MKIPKKYQVLINVSEVAIGPLKDFHKHIRCILVNHDTSEMVRINIPFLFDKKFFFESIDFATYMNHIQNESWIDDDLWFYRINDASVFLDRVRNLLVDIEKDQLIEWRSDLSTDEKLEKLIDILKEENSDLFETI